MEKDDIRLKYAIVHILHTEQAMPVLSDTVLTFGSDFDDFIRGHICRVVMGDDVKPGKFDEEEPSAAYNIIKAYNKTEQDFVQRTQDLATELFKIMNSNIDIPPADIIMVHYEADGEEYFAILKMNYKTSYTHQTISDSLGNINDIILQKALLPSETQKLSEACIINLTDYSVRIVEKKYDVNGVKVNYMSKMFLNCTGRLSTKSKIAIVEKAVNNAVKKYYNESEQFEVQMETKSIINKEIEEAGTIDVPVVIDRIFKENVSIKDEVKEDLSKYHLEKEPLTPVNKNTTKKYEKQFLKTDTGIEIKIPMEQYNSKDAIEFITNPDGTISMLIKNIGNIKSK